MVGLGSGNAVKVEGQVSGTQGVRVEGDGQEKAVVAGTVPAGGRVPEGPDPELRPRAGRRRFTTAYKLRVLAEADRCAKGEIGTLLRREGLYSSHLTDWRRQREAGLLATGKGRAAGEVEEARRALARAQRENRRLQERLARAETIISVQKKLSALLQLGTQEREN